MNGRTDVLYSFVISEDSTLVRYVSGAPRGFLTVMDAPPIRGSRQNSRVVPRTFIREDYTSTFADSLEGLVSLGEVASDRVHYIYVLADPAIDRFPATRLQNGGGAKKGFADNVIGAFTGKTFLGRSGPLLVTHPPEFIVVGWDYDDDGGDDFNTTGIIQIPSDIPNMESVDANRKDNRNITVDSGLYINKGDAIPSLNNGRLPGSVSTVDLLFLAEDADNAENFKMNIFLSTQSGLTKADLGGDISTLEGAIRIPGTDTLDINSRIFIFDPVIRDSATNQATSIIPAGEYFVYFAATDRDAGQATGSSPRSWTTPLHRMRCLSGSPSDTLPSWAWTPFPSTTSAATATWTSLPASTCLR